MFGQLERRAVFVALVAFLACGAVVPAQERVAEQRRPSLDPSRPIHHYVHEVWTSARGLPPSAIRDIVQGPEGYLWLATHAGLVRFDGARFKTFSTANSPGLGTNFLTRLCLGRDGTLWIASRVGLVRFRDGAFSTLTEADGLAGPAVEDLAEDGEGTLWMVAGGEAHRLEGERPSVLERSGGYEEGWINSVAGGTEGSMWFTTRDQGVLRWQSGEWQSFDPDGGPLPGVLRSVYTDRIGSPWITGAGREPWWLVHHTDGQLVGYRNPDGFGRVRGLHQSRDGTLWIAAQGGLARLAGGRLDLFVPGPEVRDVRFLTVHEDREGGLWAGTYGGGLHRFSEGPITTYTEQDGLPGQVLAVFEDRDRNLWVGSMGGLFRFESGRFARVGQVPESVWAISQDAGGVLWFGTRNALVRHAVGEWVRYPSERPVTLVYPDREGPVYVNINDSGVARFTEGEFSGVDALGRREVRWIDEDSQGDLWFGTRQSGLGRLGKDGFSWIGAAEGLSSNSLLSFHRDDEGALWIGAEGGGLNRLTEDAITSYSSSDGLHDDSIWPILEDEQENLWMSGDHGIFSVSKQALADFDSGAISAIPSIAYGVADGLRTLEGVGIGEPSGWRTSDGRLWFALADGVAVVDPKLPKGVRAPPPVTLEEVRVDEEERAPEGLLEIGPDAGDVEFRFTALSFFKPRDIQFQYQLLGYDEDWRDSGARRTVHYANLPPGDYGFRVRARYPSGEWGAAADELRLRRRPRWWETWWFRSVAALAALALGVSIVRLRTRRLARRANQLQEESQALLRSTERLKESLEEQARVQAELEASEALGRSTLDSLASPVAVLGPGGTIRKVNETWRRSARERGASREVAEGVGLNYLEECRAASRRGDEGAAECLSGLESLLAGEIAHLDLEYPCHSPSERHWFLLRAVPLNSAEGGAVMSHIEITEARLAELARSESEARVRQQREELSRLQRIAAMGEMAGALSHEISQPLTAIRSNTSAALRFLRLEKPDLREVHEILEDIDRDNRRAAEVVHNLHGLLKKDAGEARLVDVNELVEQTALLLKSDAMFKRITVDLQLAETLPRVRGNFVQLQQVLVNLMSNGFEAMEAVPAGERRLVLSTSTAPEGFVGVAVSDAGHGLGEEGDEVFFAPFQTTKSRGLGIGLSISRSIVEAHGGKIWAENSTDRGATFSLKLPVVTPLDEAGGE